MERPKKTPADLIRIREIDRELIIKGAQTPAEVRFRFADQEGSPLRNEIMKHTADFYNNATSLPPDESLAHLTTWQLVEKLAPEVRKMAGTDVKGIWGFDDRLDYYEIKDEKVRQNAQSTAAVCTEQSLIPLNCEYSVMKIKNYGELFNLADIEPFRDQPTAAGQLCTGFLAADDIIATAGHFVYGKEVTGLRFAFGFNMPGRGIIETRIPNAQIYRGSEIVALSYNCSKPGDDWALIRLDRKVTDRPPAVMSPDNIPPAQSVYVIGYPLGLPLKYAPGANVNDIQGSHFGANLDVYSGSSGSPVFRGDTHEVVGIVSCSDGKDFRWTERGWVSVIYDDRAIETRSPRCVRMLEIGKYCPRAAV